MSAGIDYSGTNETCNRDSKTGIRYGIIAANSLADWIWDEFEADYWRGCGHCGTELATDDEWGCNVDDETICPNCEQVCDDDSDQYGEEPIGYTYVKGGLRMSIDSHGYVWVLRSPLTIRAWVTCNSNWHWWKRIRLRTPDFKGFCSPCAPGACHLESPCADEWGGAECYAVPRDWFDDDYPCPYALGQI